MSSFGWEYAYHSKWGTFQRLFMKTFGMVDLPSRIRARAVLAALANASAESVLDIGAGTGVYAFYLTRDPNCRAVAIDTDAKRIEAIKSIAGLLQRKRLSTVCGDEFVLATLPAGDFSLVLAVEVLQYFRDLKRTLRNLRERLRPGGILIAHVPVRDALWPFEHILFNDAVLEDLIVAAGFEKPEIRQTFGRSALTMCAVFAWCASSPALLAVIYPLLLLATTLTPSFVDDGEYRLVVARKPSGTRKDQ